MRWMWIDRVVELIPRERLVAIKNVSLAEEHLHDHFAAVVDERGAVLRPATLVGHAEDFREKVILAKVGKAHLERDATPGCQLRYTAEIKSFSEIGASISGTVELAEPTTTTPTYRTIGSIELIFSHLDRNMAGVAYPEHNFVFGEGFKTLLRTSGVID